MALLRNLIEKGYDERLAKTLASVAEDMDYISGMRTITSMFTKKEITQDQFFTMKSIPEDEFGTSSKEPIFSSIIVDIGLEKVIDKVNLNLTPKLRNRYYEVLRDYKLSSANVIFLTNKLIEEKAIKPLSYELLTGFFHKSTGGRFYNNSIGVVRTNRERSSSTGRRSSSTRIEGLRFTGRLIEDDNLRNFTILPKLWESKRRKERSEYIMHKYLQYDWKTVKDTIDYLENLGHNSKRLLEGVFNRYLSGHYKKYGWIGELDISNSSIRIMPTPDWNGEDRPGT